MALVDAELDAVQTRGPAGAGRVRVVVLGLDAEHGPGDVDHRDLPAAGVEHDPAAPVAAADGEAGHVHVEPALKEEEVGVVGDVPALLRGPPAQLCFPLRVVVVEQLGDRDDRFPPHAEERFGAVFGGQRAGGGGEVGAEDDVRVDVADELVRGQLLAAAEDRGHERRAVLVAVDLRDVAHAKLSRELGCSFVVAEEDHLRLWIEPQPTADGVLLDGVELTLERLWDGEDGEHRVSG